MAFAAASRPLRLPAARNFVQLRAASTTQEATKQASERTQAAMQSAQNYASSATASASKIASQVGDRASGLLGCLFCVLDMERILRRTAYREPVVYNLAVAREIAKQVYIKEGLAPPTSVGQITQVYSQMYQQGRDLNWWKTLLEGRQWLRFGIYAIEAYGIFKIGEMVGRRHVVGYKLEGPAPKGHH